MAGGSITIPIDINVLETTISTSINGRKIINPAVNARFNSEVINDGMTTVIGKSSMFSAFSVWDKSTN